MNYKKVADEIKLNVGGSSNIKNVTHCATRLRFILSDDSKFNDEANKKIDDVVNIIKIGDEFQIIIGHEVKNVYKAFVENDKDLIKKVDGLKSEKTIKTVLLSIASYIQASLGTIIPLLIGTGLIKAVLAILLQLELVTATNDTYIVLYFASDAMFYFMGVIAAIGAARKLNADIPMAVFMALMLLSPTFVSNVTNGVKMTVFGMPIYSVSYANSFLPIIIVVWVMSKLDTFFDEHLPLLVKDVLRPTLVILIMIPLSFCVLGPSVTWIANLLAQPFTTLLDYPWALTALFGLLMPILIMFGIHGIFFSVVSLNLFAQLGYDPFMMPGGYCSFFAITAVALVVAFKTKQKRYRSQCLSSGLSLFFGGVSEPAIFTVLVKNKMAMIIACISGGIGGLIAGLLSTKCYNPVGGSLTLFIYYVGPESPMSSVLIAAGVSVVIAVVASLIVFKDGINNNDSV